MESYPPKRAYQTLTDKPADIRILKNTYYVDAPARHISLATALDWSYRLLTPEQQKLFRRIAIFVEKRHPEYDWQDWEEQYFLHASCIINNDLPEDLNPLVRSLFHYHLLETWQNWHYSTNSIHECLDMLYVIREYAKSKAEPDEIEHVRRWAVLPPAPPRPPEDEDFDEEF